ncbi:MAG TPA: hypothetical protein ENI73_01890 [Spirochaetes bacterium]|nr:hypothetical protein [Spirochaetota bacterium]
MEEGANPRDVKVQLAKEIIISYYSQEEADQAESEFKKVFAKKELPEDIPEYKVSGKEIWIVKLLTDSGLTQSSSEGRRLIKGGGLYVDNERVTDEKHILSVTDGMIIKAGKRKFLKLIT